MSSDLKNRLVAAIEAAQQRSGAIDPYADCDLTFEVCTDEMVSDFGSEVAFGVFGFEDLCRFLELTPEEVTAKWGWDEGSGTWGYMEVSVNSQTLSPYIEAETEINVLTEFLPVIQF